MPPGGAAYLAVGDLETRSRAANAVLRDCRLCPRACGVNRLNGETGYCRTGALATVASAFPHHGEENCLRGTRGSGTIFFGQCNLRCVFCQNHDISQESPSPECAPDDIAEAALALQRHGCHNINFVTPTHVVPQLIEAVRIAAGRGLKVPIVYNTSAYDAVDTLRLLDGIVDIYMPDFKFWEPETARRLAAAPDYPDRAREAVREMHRQTGCLQMDSNGIARSGVLVRHLVMPGQAAESREIFRWLANEVSPDTFVNVMAQYRPEHLARTGDYPEIDRAPAMEEYQRAMEAAGRTGLHRFG